MKTTIPCKAALALALVLFAGCTTRSISNSGYGADRASYGWSTVGGYRGELSELDVLGVSSDSSISERDISTALATAEPPRLERNSKVLLVQSGADFPDEPMVTALSQRFRVLPFSGHPSAKPEINSAYSKTLRLAAARGGYDKIICYWGVLESAQENQVTKAVSWVPLAGYFVPDQKQSMRIRLKAAIVDVASGRWTFVMPAPATSSDFSSIVSRRNVDQSLVAELQEAGYRNLVRELVEKHTG